MHDAVTFIKAQGVTGVGGMCPCVSLSSVGVWLIDWLKNDFDAKTSILHYQSSKWMEFAALSTVKCYSDVHLMNITLFLGNSTKTAATRAALFDSNIH